MVCKVGTIKIRYMEEKIQIMLFIDPFNLLNQRCDFIAKCRNKNKFRLFSKISE